jgi:hypothetical protein
MRYVGNPILALRQVLGLTQSEMAIILFCSPADLLALESLLPHQIRMQPDNFAFPMLSMALRKMFDKKTSLLTMQDWGRRIRRGFQMGDSLWATRAWLDGPRTSGEVRRQQASDRFEQIVQRVRELKSSY